MSMTLIKLLNLSYPSLKVFVRITDHKNEIMPDIIQQVYSQFHCNINGYLTVKQIKRESYKFAYDSKHLVYSRSDTGNFIKSMVNQFNQNTGLCVNFIPDVYSTYKGMLSPVEIPKRPFILIPSCGVELNRKKDWGFNNFNQLAKLLKNEFDIVQIGAKGDPELPYADYYYLGYHLGVIHYLMTNCYAFVGISNGLSVFAGHHDIKSFILYHKKSKDKTRNQYKSQIQYDFDSPQMTYMKIKENLFNVSD